MKETLPEIEHTIKKLDAEIVASMLKKIGSACYTIRKAKHLKQVEMVAIIGGRQNDYGPFETGQRNLTLKSLALILDVLNMKLTLTDETGQEYLVFEPTKKKNRTDQQK